MQSGRHQEVARSLRGRAGDRRRLDLDEVVTRQHRARSGIHPGTQSNRRSGVVAAQIEVAVLQSQLLTRRFVQLKRQRRTFAQHGQRRGVDLDLAGGDLRVGVAFRADLDDAGHRYAEFRTQPVSLRQHLSVLGVAEHHLCDARSVPQIDEDHAAVVAAASHPAGQCHLLPGVAFP